MAKALLPAPPMPVSRPSNTPPTSRPPLAWIARLARTVHAGRGWRDAWNAAALFVRLAVLRRHLGPWRGTGQSPLPRMLRLRPSLVSVVRRPYISTGWNALRRLQAVEAHYAALRGPARALWLEPRSAVRLARVATKAGALDVVLDSPEWFIHEGELSLNLFHVGERIYSLVFSLGCDGGEPVAFVGALQGLGREHALQRYRTLTRELHGLRPRDLLIAAFRALCRALGVRRWLAVDDRHRVSASCYFGREIEVHSSYDAAWAEHGGASRADGFHAMATAARRRSPDDIPSRKRSAYRQRYAMLDRLDADIAAALEARASHADAALLPRLAEMPR